MKRPVGVSIVAVLLWMGAVLAIAGEVAALLIPSLGITLSQLELILLLVWSLGVLAGGIGLWLMQPWGWYIAQIALIMAVVVAGFNLVGGITTLRNAPSATATTTAVVTGAIFGIGAATIIYLCLPDAWRRIFPSTRGDTPPGRLLIHIILILACVITIYPVLRIVSVSLRPGDRLLSTDLSIIPPDATMNNFRTVLVERPFFSWLWNSLVITVSTAVVGVILAATSAYAFSRWRFPGRAPGLIFLLATQMIPAAMLTVPIYIVAVRLGLINSYRGLVLAYSVSSVPFSIWILKGYYDTIPVDLEEAAMIDGASRLSAFWRIILPLSTPALAIVFLFNFMTAWNDFLMARIMLQKEELLTWVLGLQRMQGQFQTEWGAFAAASILVSIPVMALFLYSSKWLISGLTLGSVKG
jgi:arabinogalactan oligomer/maltooligosaccharide transport system permease protein